MFVLKVFIPFLVRLTPFIWLVRSVLLNFLFVKLILMNYIKVLSSSILLFTNTCLSNRFHHSPCFLGDIFVPVFASCIFHQRCSLNVETIESDIFEPKYIIIESVD